MDRIPLRGAAVAGLVLVAAAVLVLPGDPAARSLDAAVTTATIPAEDYRVTALQRDRIGDVRRTAVDARTNDSFLRLEVLAGIGTAGPGYVNRTRNGILSRYIGSQAPYGDDGENATSCPDRFLPERGTLSDRPNATHLVLYSDADREYGACSPAEAVYRTHVFFLRCGADLHHARLHVPVERSGVPAVLQGFRCASR